MNFNEIPLQSKLLCLYVDVLCLKPHTSHMSLGVPGRLARPLPPPAGLHGGGHRGAKALVVEGGWRSEGGGGAPRAALPELAERGATGGHHANGHEAYCGGDEIGRPDEYQFTGVYSMICTRHSVHE